uniref:Uncharacterized protein n=1 Tax=Setaria digitata TaxID=48799 RepID=A0A915PTV9_9BILA
MSTAGETITRDENPVFWTSYTIIAVEPKLHLYPAVLSNDGVKPKLTQGYVTSRPVHCLTTLDDAYSTTPIQEDSQAVQCGCLLVDGTSSCGSARIMRGGSGLWLLVTTRSGSTFSRVLIQLHIFC